MQQPKISVVIPVYNAEPFLRQCLDSVLSQPFKDLEIICVNDGSTDSSPQILDEYAKKDVRIHVIHQPNLHSGIARNNGLEAATGEYIHFLDSDDYLTENAYEETYRIAHEHQLDYLKTKAYAIDAATGEIRKGIYPDMLAQKMMQPEDYIKPFSFSEAPEKLIRQPVYAPWCGMYKRQFLMENNVRFDHLLSFDDHSFYYAAAIRAQRVMVADVYMVWYRMDNPNSLVGNYLTRFEGHLESFNIISEYCQFLPQKVKALVLTEEVSSLLYWYNIAINKNINLQNVRQAMYDFVSTFDISQIIDICRNKFWYIEYLLLKLEVAYADNSLSEDELSKLPTEMWRILYECIHIPAYKIQRNSRIVLYGAGNIGKKVYRILKASNFCEVILWVDKNWEVICRAGMPVSSPDLITSVHFDSILIAIEKPEVASAIQSWLTNMSVSKEKIISNADNSGSK